MNLILTERIGKYEIRGKLGEGATSTVYLGYDEFAQREVAIKVVFPEALKDHDKGRQHLHMLINEASLAGKLIHPHIAQIYDAVVSDEQSYIVMEYVPGGTLEQFILPDHLLPIDRLVEIIFKCTRALDYAFIMGVTHRDIKPANILLTKPGGESEAGGDIKISDFGAALTLGNEQTQVSGVGSPAYMSPQQCLGEPIGDRWRRARRNHAPPSTFRTEIPPSLDAVVARAMQKKLDARYASWGDFSHDLAQAFRNRQLSEKQQDYPDSEKFETLRALHFFNEFSDVEIWEVVRFSKWEEIAPKPSS